MKNDGVNGVSTSNAAAACPSASVQFTPGPWKLVRNHYDRLAIVGPRNDGKSINSDRICNAPHRKDGQGEANCRLIAAAPDMLALLTVLRDEWFEPHYGGNDIGHAALLRDYIRKTIAKATGAA